MYKEIHPFYYDSQAAHHDIVTGTTRNDGYMRPQEPMVLDLRTIRQVRKSVPDGYSRLSVTDAHEDDITVSDAEAQEIRQALLRDSGDTLAKEVERLTTAVRNLHELLRARMR